MSEEIKTEEGLGEIQETEKEIQEEFKNEDVQQQTTMNRLEENFHIFVKRIRKRVRKKYDMVIGITGEEGEGKTTLGIQIGKEADENFDMERNIVFNPDKEKVKKLILELPKYSVVDVDEAIKILYKMQWYSDIQHLLNVIYALCRRENKISLLLMPRFKDFNEFFRNHRIKLWIHIVQRGIAVVFGKDWSPFVKDPWRMDDNQKVLDAYYKRYKGSYLTLDIKERVRILSKSPNFLDVFSFQPLTEEEEKRFEELRSKSGIYDEEITMTRFEKKWKDRFANLCYWLHVKEGKTYKWIADRVGDIDPVLITQIVREISKREEENAPT
ncbi:MAG: hypothetical protein NZ893_01550 [Candidatus Aenigmarchaeota archaeon]|nr:hypothetical protein [Candidatus Aenigmarchaeota archaeon]